MRSKRSAKPAVTKPEMPALNAYADTTSPNCLGVIASAGMIIAPSGAMIMKSRMTANCRNASSPTTNFWYEENEAAGAVLGGGMVRFIGGVARYRRRNRLAADLPIDGQRLFDVERQPTTPGYTSHAK